MGGRPAFLSLISPGNTLADMLRDNVTKYLGPQGFCQVDTCSQPSRSLRWLCGRIRRLWGFRASLPSSVKWRGGTCPVGLSEWESRHAARSGQRALASGSGCDWMASTCPLDAQLRVPGRWWPQCSLPPQNCEPPAPLRCCLHAGWVQRPKRPRLSGRYLSIHGLGGTDHAYPVASC